MTDFLGKTRKNENFKDREMCRKIFCTTELIEQSQRRKKEKSGGSSRI